ncbi:putative C-type lectin domain family 20 member A [Boleophthalmus pectinirostris]|uniref:putative C-type lectin domain family 20 member A n=1 Tax=Boleophthalmus pectinirostris TaxID=150288 RepID=UPI0024321ED8|nr:putative C-type lectin domain family 20 member A [Boleophthalmus pectinirostris]
MESNGLWAIVLCGFTIVFPSFHTVKYEYQFVNTLMTWSEAQQYCRLYYDDLATFTSMEDIQRVKRPSEYLHAWIGLFNDTVSWKGIMGNESYKWSFTGATSPAYRSWETGWPDFDTAETSCVMTQNGLWSGTNCSLAMHTVCFRGALQPRSKIFTWVKSNKDWITALQYCRERYLDLAVIEDESEVTRISNLIGQTLAWIGLIKQPLRWSDNTISSFRNWINGGVDKEQSIKYCVIESSATGHHWSGAPCEEKHHAICEQGNSV